jgi:hypothetical protein
MGSTGGGRAGRHTRVLGCSPWAAHTFLFLSAARWTAPLDLTPCSLPRSRVVTSVPPLISQTRGAHGKYGRGAGWLPREGTGLLPMDCTNFPLLFLARWTAPLDLASPWLPRPRAAYLAPPPTIPTRGADGKYGRGAATLLRAPSSVALYGCSRSSLTSMRGGPGMSRC